MLARSSAPHHQPNPDAGPGGPQDGAPAPETATRPDRDCRPARDGVLNGARRADPPSGQTAHRRPFPRRLRRGSPRQTEETTTRSSRLLPPGSPNPATGHRRDRRRRKIARRSGAFRSSLRCPHRCQSDPRLVRQPAPAQPRRLNRALHMVVVTRMTEDPNPAPSLTTPSRRAHHQVDPTAPQALRRPPTHQDSLTTPLRVRLVRRPLDMT